MSGTVDPIRVLHVDDEPRFTDLTREFLERADDRIDVRTAASVNEALELLHDADIDCVVSDYDMPGRNGIEFLATVRETRPDLPFILYTGKGSEEVAGEAISAGVTDYLRKDTGPEQYSILANRVANAVEGCRAQRRLETLISNVPGVVYRARNEPGWPMELVRGDAERLTGYSAAALQRGEVGWGDDVLHPDDRDRLWTTVQDALADGDPFEVTYRIRTASGDTRWMWERGRAVRSASGSTPGETVALEGIITDITDRKQREQELESQRDRYRSLFENNPLIVWEHDYAEAMAYLESLTAGIGDVEAYLLEHPEELSRVADRIRTIDVNQAALSYYDAPSKRVLLDSIDEVMHEDGTEVFAKQLAAFAAGDTRFRAETVSQSLSGDRHEEVIQVVVPEGSHDDYSRVYVIGTDITEQKQRERQIQRQNNRLDKFTSVVSHDLRNPLNIAHGRLELAADECDSPFLDDVADAHDRMERLIDDLLTFARAGSDAIDSEPVELPDLFDECWATLRDGDASLTVGTDATVRADPDRLRQLLRNLLANAVEHGSTSSQAPPDDAVEHGSTGSRPESDDAVEHGSTSSQAPPDDAVEHGSTSNRAGADDTVEHGKTGVSITVGDTEDGFYVADDGPGIPESDREAVFDAGYSTTRDGTGFGLSIVGEVAEAHGWNVRVTESADGGARFEIVGVERVS